MRHLAENNASREHVVMLSDREYRAMCDLAARLDLSLQFEGAGRAIDWSIFFSFLEAAAHKKLLEISVTVSTNDTPFPIVFREDARG